MVLLYKDRELTEVIEELHFGTVEVGKSETLTVFILNETDASFFIDDIEFNPDERGLEVMSAPNALAAREIQPIMIRWSPPLSLRRALVTKIHIVGREVYVAR